MHLLLYLVSFKHVNIEIDIHNICKLSCCLFLIYVLN